MDISVTRILSEARLLLLTKGWVQNAYGSENTGFCLTGSIDRAYTKLRSKTKGVKTRMELHYNRDNAYTLIKSITKGASIPSWNDQKGRKRPQVLSVIDRAILKENKKK